MAVNAYLEYLEALGKVGAGPIASSMVYLEAFARVSSPAQASLVYVEVLSKILVPAPYVPDTSVPWTIAPDWQNGVTERLKWKTDVMQSVTGVEQRKPIRITPRREIEARYLIYRNTRRLYENLLAGPGAGYFRVPCWWEKVGLASGAVTGDTTLLCDSSNLEMQRGDTVMILSDPWTYELLVVQGLTDAGIALQNTVANNWPAGAQVYLTRKCVLTGAVKGTRRSDDVNEITMTFETREPNPWPAVIPTTNIGVPVLFAQEDFREDTTEEYTRLLSIFDNDTGQPVQLDQALQAFRHAQVLYTAFNRAQHNALRGMLYYFAGRLNPFYYATHNADVELAFDVADGATTLQIINQGYALYGGPENIGRSIIGFFFGSGATPILVTVASAVLQENGYELLTLTGPIAVGFAAASVQRASFMQIYRQDADEIELQHITDSAGATVLKTTFISAQNDRSGTDYDLAPAIGYQGDNLGL